MVSRRLAKEAREAWLTYGLEVARVFGFAPLPVIVKAPLDDVLATSNDAAVERFIAYARRQTVILKDRGETAAQGD
jgi:hypothetical protein